MNPYLPGAETQPDPVYYAVVTFGSLAEHIAEVLNKGDRVVVSGRVEDDTWVGRDVLARASLKIIADGIGKDLRFGQPPARTAPKSSKLADGLLGTPPPAMSDHLEPF